MSAVTLSKPSIGVPRLEPGDHLDQKTFHARYKAMRKDAKAELISGVVYIPAALGRPHSQSHAMFILWLMSYQNATPGVEAHDNATTIMDEDSEPQPDACLIILPENGGQMRFTEDDGEEFLEGAPEFVGEIASSTESYDLHSKKNAYKKAGVKEYVVVALRQHQVFWFVNRDGQFQNKSTDDGILRSGVFPGLWLDPIALLKLDGKRLLEVLDQGVNTDEHSDFVNSLCN